jgi:protein-tyrosine-phosphatase
MTGKRTNEFEVLFVCTGNTCRSPMAQGVLKKMLRDSQIEGVRVASAGTYGLHCAFASPLALEVAGAYGVDLSPHRSRELTEEMIKKADLILVMSQQHLDHIRRSDPKAVDKTYLLKAFPRRDAASNEDSKAGVLSIKDPVGGSLEDYEKAFFEIEEELIRIFPELLRLAGKS